MINEKLTNYMQIILDIVTCPIIVCIFFLCLIVTYKIRALKNPKSLKPTLPKLHKRDFTVNELLEFDGTRKDGRILVAVNGYVFDVTNDDQDRYGIDGPYHSYAGRDASRALARFNAELNKSICYDDLIDLTTDEMKNLKEWERQFRKIHPEIGRLLAPGETHAVYADDDIDRKFHVSKIDRNASFHSNEGEIFEEDRKNL